MSTGASVVGVVGDTVDDIAAAIEAGGGRAQTGEIETVLSTDPDAILTVGEATTYEVARCDPTAPVVPVDAGRGLRAVPGDRLDAACASLVAGDWWTETHPLVRIEHRDDTVGTALTDVTLVTSEAARISEFSVAADGAHVGQFRADGVVVATPAGTPGYASRVGTPIAAAETGVLTVAPIAPFATDPAHWTVPDESLTLTVERDEAAVTLFADDQSVCSVGFDTPVELTTDRTVTVAILPESQPRFV